MNPADSNRRRVENYRESCDNCAKSKVRCGKEQPWCQRCVRRNQICSYSPSQRSRKRTLSTTNTEGEQWTGTVPFLPMNGGSASAMSKDASALLGQADGWGPCPDLVELLASDCSTESVTPENMNLIWLSEMEAMAGDRNMNKGLERMDTLLFPQTSGIGASPSTDTGISSVASIDNMGPGLKRSTTNREHCEADLMTTLRKLDLPSFSCRGEPKTSQNLGNVLTTSRSALSCLSKTVLCTCAPSDNVALLVTAAILRILSWHDIVLQNCHGSRGNTTTTTSVEGSFDSPVESPDNDELDGMSTKDTDMPQEGGEGPGLFMPPMTIGAYELDSENRERMIGHILLSELSKMGRLLNNFSKKFCDPQSITLSNDNKSQLYLALEMFIRSKHSVTVLAVRKKMEAK